VGRQKTVKEKYAGLVGSALVGGAALEVSCSFCREQVRHNGSCDVLHLLVRHAMSACHLYGFDVVGCFGRFCRVKCPAWRRKKKGGDEGEVSMRLYTRKIVSIIRARFI
jgi:hypothetical protein